MLDVDRLCVVGGPIQQLKFLARESGDPAIDHELNIRMNELVLLSLGAGNRHSYRDHSQTGRISSSRVFDIAGGRRGRCGGYL